MKFFCPSCSVNIVLDDQDASSTVRCPSCGTLLDSNQNGSGRIPLDETVELRNVLSQVGKYQIQRLLGTGGYGRVYLAKDKVLLRSVAIKVPRVDRFSSEKDRKRFIEEAQLAARLQHPGIVTIYDAAIEDDECYIAMEYVEAQTLKQAMALRAFSIPEAVRLVSLAARAAHYAHQQGLVHRDLKPSNILIDADLQPRIADFGLAVDLVNQWNLRGQVAGTPAYMSPEQVRGDSHRLDGRTDIWSLGVILYELLTRTTPFSHKQDRSFDEVLNRDPRPLRQINDAIPAELERICLKCLQKSPGQRYNTALDLAVELERVVLVNDPGLSTVSNGRWVSDTAMATKSTIENGHLRTGLLVIVACAVVAGAFAIGWSQFRQPEDSSDKPTLPPSAQSPGESQGAKPRFRPRVWNDLLDRKPKAVYWLPDSVSPKPGWDEARQLVSIDTDEIGMLGLGDTKAVTFRLQTGIQKNSWSGFAGLYWGYRERMENGKRTAVCQILCINVVDPPELLMQRFSYTIVYSGSTPFVQSVAIGPPIPVRNPGSAPTVLEIEVDQGQLTAVRWDGIAVDKLTDKTLARTEVQNSNGGFGIINNSGATNFEKAQFLLKAGQP